MNSYQIIEQWFIDNQLYYTIDPTNDSQITEYMINLSQSLPELYRMLRDNELIPEDSYQSFSRFLERMINTERQKAVMGE